MDEHWRKQVDQLLTECEKLQEQNKVMREALEYVYNNCSLIQYELVGRDGYLPYPKDMEFIQKALEQADKIRDE